MDTARPTLKPAAVAALMVEHTVQKHNTPYQVIFLKAFLAGVMLSFGGLLSEVTSGGATSLTTSNPGLAKVLGGFVFPVGLVMIVLNGYELLTSNMMYFPMAVIKRAVPWWSLPVNWIIVTFGNLVGSLFFGAILVKYSGIVSTAPYNTYIVEFAMKKASEPEWHQIFLRGIGCNWLVCIAVWQAAGARDTISKILAIWIPIWVFVACSYDHVVANMFSVPLGIMFGADLTVAEYIRKSLIAAYLGNIIGALFVGMPATYFYLRDYNAGSMRAAENGELSNDEHEVRDIDSDKKH
ncbi:Formate/nitrite transporter [Lentinula boryana]|uniref:Formate/nitrite transporter n=1 Tax=Lentinula boryana TaxID=40481 RepID=A0ABQ8QTU8_9AGAR|nr:Formate/nitrite transporter [Lentinula boryana]